MRKILVAFCLFAGLNVSAASFKVNGSYSVMEGIEAYHPVLNDAGNKILYSTEDFVGLKLYDSVLNTTEVISTSVAAGFTPVFTANGDIYYRSSKMQGRLRYTNLMQRKNGAKASIELIPMNRDNSKLQVCNGKFVAKSGKCSIGLDKGLSMAYDDYDAIVLVQNGVEKRISPLGTGHTYTSASLSPDGTKLVFTEPYEGVFTCNLDGFGLKSFGRGDMTKWLDNDHIVFVKSRNDGHFVIESRLYVLNINTRSALALTPSSVIVDDHSIAVNAGKIVYGTEEGKLFMIEFDIEK